MLAEERLDAILRIVEKEGSVTVQSLIEVLNSSESTIRRDLNTLGKRGLLIKVHGGAIALENAGVIADSDVLIREDINRELKKKIAMYAASLIKPNEFVYLDAGTTTGYLIDYLLERKVTFVTNGIMHARKLASKGYVVYLPSGQLKPVTEAIVGEETIAGLRAYHFTKGFFGANGVDEKRGYTTPDIREARIKQCAVEQCAESFMLCDESKFGKVSSVTFAAFEAASVITAGNVNEKFYEYDNVFTAK